MCICVPILRMGRKVSRQKKLITVLKEIFGKQFSLCAGTIDELINIFSLYRVCCAVL